MPMTITGVHCDLGEALKYDAQTQLQALASKFGARDGLDAQVTVSRDNKGWFKAGIKAKIGRESFHADSITRDAHRAISDAVTKLRKQLRRTKRLHTLRMHGRLKAVETTSED